MFSIIGIVLVFAAVIGGFLMEKGKLPVLVQPAELLIIGGSAIGTLLAANPLPLIIKIFKSLIGMIGGSRFTAAFYLESLKMLSDIFQFARKSGMAKLEEDIENPGKSAVFSKYPKSDQRPSRSVLHLRHAADRGGGCGCSARSGRPGRG